MPGSSTFTRLDDLPQIPGIPEQYLQIQVTQKHGCGKHNLVLCQKRAYRQSNSEDAWYLLTNLVNPDQTLKADSSRCCIEPLFKDYKSGGYHFEEYYAD